MATKPNKPMTAGEPEAEPSLVKAKVRPGNTYGAERLPAGSVVEVPASELALIPHCLVALDQEGNEVTPPKPKSNAEAQAEAGRAIFQAMRNMHKGNSDARIASETALTARKIELDAQIAAKR